MKRSSVLTLRGGLAFGIAALIAAIVGGCTSGDDTGQSSNNQASDRGQLEGPATQLGSELNDISRLRTAAITSGGGNPSGVPLVEDTRSTAIPLMDHPRLHYTAIRHTGVLASITAADPYGGYLDTTVKWAPCPGPPTNPRWSLSNQELFPLPELPLTTNTVTANTWFGDPASPPGPPKPKPGTPFWRYIFSTWATPGADPASFDIMEYYVREPFIPNAGGSRVLSAFLNRYGRLGLIRNRSALFGYGSITEAFAINSNVLGPGLGGFLGSPSPFRGTLIYETDNARTPYVPSFWPGAPDEVTGNAPITYGWSIDPEDGTVCGPAIHAASDSPICSVTQFEMRYTPFGDESSPTAPFHPFFRDNAGTLVPDAKSDSNFTRAADDPVFNTNADPLLPIFPIHFNVYKGVCFPVATIPASPYSVFDSQILDTAYLPNEVFIVPVLKPEWQGKLPPGTYQLHMVLTAQGATPPCTPWLPTTTAATQTRYFYVWNDAVPNYFRP